MTDEEKVLCPVCEHEVGTKEDGTLIRAHKISGEKCAGSDEPVPTDEENEGVEKGGSYEPTDETPADPELDGEGDAESTAATYVHKVRVHGSCPYLEDEAWHAANKKMAAVAAKAEGVALAGEEAVLDHLEPDGDHIVVVYTVPTK